MYEARISIDYRDVESGPWRIIMRELSRDFKACRIVKMLSDCYPEKVINIPIGHGYSATFEAVDDEVRAVVTAERWDISPKALGLLREEVKETLERILEPYLRILDIINVLYGAGLVKGA